MAYVCPKQCTDLKERSELPIGIQGFFPTASHLFISAPLFDLPAQHPASAMGWHFSSETQVVVAVLTPALCTCAQACTRLLTHMLSPRE